MIMLNTLPLTSATGYEIAMKQTDPRHIGNGSNMAMRQPNVEESFSDALVRAVTDVQTLQENAEGKVSQFVLNPDSVGIDEVTVALSKAETSLQFMKAVTDRVVQAYRTLTQMR